MPNPTEMPPSPAAIASELTRIAESRSFRKAERCLRLLRYVIERALDGRGGELKEYTLAVSVFERPNSFDPRVDPVVRLEARRLRLKLAEYYQEEGLDDAVIIDLPKGAYVPRFRLRDAPQAAPEVRRPGPPFRPWMAIVAAALCVSLGAWFLMPKRHRAAVRMSVAVLGFRNLSAAAETSWIDPAVSELIGIELGAGQRLRTLPAENVARMRRELSVTPQSMYPAQTLERIGTNLGADYAVAGAYQTHGERVRLDIVLFDLRRGQQIAAIGDESAQDKLSDLALECARRIRAHLGVRLSSVQGDSGYPPAEPAAMESYARGMERLRQSDALGALPYLERAATFTPVNPLVRSGLAAAWSQLGLDNRAIQEAKQAFDSSSQLGRVEQLEIEGRYRELAHDWQRAIQVYQALFTLLPDDLEYGLMLANAETRGGQARDALNVVNALRKLPAPIGDDPRIDLAEAQSAGALADFAHTRRAAHSAAEKAGKRGARLQYARARLLESGAMQNLDIAGFADVRAEARGICAELGDRACVAAALRIEANYWAVAGTPAKARPLYAASLHIAGEIGNQLEKLNALMGMGYTEQSQGDLKASELDYRAALEVGTEIGPQKRHSVCLDLADVLAAQGRLVESRALAEEALDGSRQASDQENIGLAQAALAHVLALQGKYPDAIAGYNDAIQDSARRRALAVGHDDSRARRRSIGTGRCGGCPQELRRSERYRPPARRLHPAGGRYGIRASGSVGGTARGRCRSCPRCNDCLCRRGTRGRPTGSGRLTGTLPRVPARYRRSVRRPRRSSGTGRKGVPDRGTCGIPNRSLDGCVQRRTALPMRIGRWIRLRPRCRASVFRRWKRRSS